MKSIIVPTDFSPAANNAAKYALHIAQRTKAGIKLCNAITVPSESVMAAQVAWPLEDIDSLKEGAEAEFNYLTTSLESLINNDEYKPYISHLTSFGNVTDMIRNTFYDDHANMVIMGMSGANMFSRFVLGSNSNDIIDKADFPVLLIPKNYRYTHIKKIAFATDLSSKDIGTLHSLANFARYFNAEILISHIAELPGDDQKLIDTFLSDVTCKVDYPNIYFRQLQSENVNKGLNWLAQNVRVDMIVMMHRRQGIFSSSYTQKLALKTKVPLMSLPDGFDKVLI